jgi:hypothetical protein
MDKDVKEKKTGNQDDCYSEGSSSNASVQEWYEVVSDFLRGMKTEEVSDDKRK